ncbi:MAG: cytosine permease [Planctomycetes bacterium]|nr:cytosine permease [Planctomycetota bacterium]
MRSRGERARAPRSAADVGAEAPRHALDRDGRGRRPGSDRHHARASSSASAVARRVVVATVSVNIAADVVSPANDFANLAPRFISFRTGGLITGLLGIAMMPWKLMASVGDYIFTWLVGYSALLGPIAGIMIVDYWVLRRRELDVAELYRPKGKHAGVRWSAIAALVVGVAPHVPGFARAAGCVEQVPAWCDAVYPYAWFTGSAIAALVSALLGRERATTAAGSTSRP